VDNPNDPRRSLESLFLELEPLNATTFAEMKVEFEAMKLFYRQGTTPNYELMQRLEEGVTIVEELQNVQAHPQDVLHFMSTSLIQRDKHYQYLQMIEQGLKRMGDRKRQYQTDVVTWKAELEMALDKSRELLLPEPFNKAAGMTQLKFESLKAVASKKLFDAEKTKALKLTFTPRQNYTLKNLEKKGVVTEVFPPFDHSEMKNSMNITFRASPSSADGGIELVVTIVKKGSATTLKTIHVTNSAMSEMKTAEKGAKTSLGNPGEDPFLSVQVTKFTELVTQLGQSTGSG